jgi:C-terminal processing protease CtpA/Prc
LTSSVALAAAGAAGEVDPVARIVRATAVYGTSAELPSLASVKQTCGTDALCAAREIVAASEGRVRLEAVAHPESDTIRWAETAPSVTAVHMGPDGRRWIVLDGFGRKALREMAQAVSQAIADGARLGLDLRGNAGGDFGRMLRVASLFTKNVKNALFLIDKEGKYPVSLVTESTFPGTRDLVVLVGSGTASSAEVLAALLTRYAGARLAGSRTAGKDHLTRVIAVDHDWRLLVPAERIEVPGVELTGGLRPAENLPDPVPPDRAPPEPRS